MGFKSEYRSFITHDWVVAAVLIFALVALAIAMLGPISPWIKIGILALSVWLCWEVNPKRTTPNYEPEEWDIEKD